MIQHPCRLTAGVLLSLSCLGAAPAQALSLLTFVSGKGTDKGTCASPTAPCRSFQFAINQTTPAGEVKALDPANYRSVTITKSISIAGVEGAGVDRTVAGNAITINAGPNDRINLSHLTIDGLKIGQSGIVLNSGGSLTATDCVVRNFTATGVDLKPTGATRFLIGNTLVSNNSGLGLLVAPQGAGSAIGALDHVSLNNNFVGMVVDGSNGVVDATSVHSVANNNIGSGFVAQLGAVLRLSHSAATRNGTGVAIGTGTTVESFGDNDIRGNGFNDVQGTLTLVATQ